MPHGLDLIEPEPTVAPIEGATGPVERVIATIHPNHTYEKLVFDPWQQATWDMNDTVLQADPKNDPDVGGFFQRLPEADYLPTWHDLRTDPNKALRQWPNFDPQSDKPFPENAEIRKQEKFAADKAAAAKAGE